MDCEGLCGQPIADGAPVWRGPLRPRWRVVVKGRAKPIDGRIATGKGRKLSMCADCARVEQTCSLISWSSRPRPCVGCGRAIFFDAVPSRYIRYPACGDPACFHAAAMTSQRERQRIAAGTHARSCKCCSIRFDPKRKDTLYCSVPCREKAYRQRRAA
jgi:hypothetical protein